VSGFMKRIIKDQKIVNDDWVLIKATDDGSFPDIADKTKAIIPLKLWLEKYEQFKARQTITGVWLDSADEPKLLLEDLKNIPVIAINFPQFVDGRGFSIGRLLRERYHYKGELRAIGDVLRDQIFFMHRCGFNTFEVRADKSIENALLAFNDFSDGYQTAVDQPIPYFRRRLIEA
jgi:uncharacterized protein (DUF934 family)